MAVLLASASSQYLNADTAAYRGSDTAGTIAFWVNHTTLAAAQMYFSSSDESSINYSFYCYVEADTNYYMTFQESDVVNGTHKVRGSTSLSTGTWYHMAFVSIDTAYGLYLNGVSETLTVKVGSNNGNWLASVSNRDNVQIGSRERNAGPGVFLNGTISDLAIWDTNLSTLQIAQLASSRLKRMPHQIAPANLVAYWPLNEVADGANANGLTFYDRIGGINLTAVGGTGAAESYLSYP